MIVDLPEHATRADHLGDDDVAAGPGDATVDAPSEEGTA